MAADSSTLLFLHAHPDDECILTGATMALANQLGHRILVAYGTRGDAGETNADLGEETLGQRRTREALGACEELGAARIEFLGFDDSGMADSDAISNPAAFSNATVEVITSRLATTFADERIDVVVGYDRNGTYGHPDHIKVHHVARHCGPELGASWVLDATYNREYMAALEDNGYGDIGENFASSEAELTHYVEGEEILRAKLSALNHHMSQVPDDFDMEKPDISGFARMFGTEWYIATPTAADSDWSVLSTMLRPKAEWGGTPPLA
ncbi:MAG: LmbE family N-acetylglucosaminyl deacetylase [Candidatus Poriferisodalaceae bacterium]|jgi:LmbE family N-acetylglucosaminyl deacetylase